MLTVLKLELPALVWGDVSRIVLALDAAVSLLVTERDDYKRALEAIKREVGTSTLAAKIAREALAGGGRTPTGQHYPDSEHDIWDDSGGLGLSAEPVAEVGAPASTYGSWSDRRCQRRDINCTMPNCECPLASVSPGAADVAEAGE